MRVFKRWLLGSCILAFVFMLSPGARASESDQKVIATFNVPVEIPGQVLPAGTYVFTILDIWSTRDVVRVFNADESKVLATTIAIPRYRSNPTDKALFVFAERGSDSPQALEAWYYPGHTFGHQFIYSSRIAPEAVTTAPSNESAANQPQAPEESSPVMSAEANTNEPTPADLAQSNQSTDQTQTAPNTSTTTSGTSKDQTDKELPKTASTTPLIALIGILLLGGAIGLKALASRVS